MIWEERDLYNSDFQLCLHRGVASVMFWKRPWGRAAPDVLSLNLLPSVHREVHSRWAPHSQDSEALVCIRHRMGWLRGSKGREKGVFEEEPVQCKSLWWIRDNKMEGNWSLRYWKGGLGSSVQHYMSLQNVREIMYKVDGRRLCELTRHTRCWRLRSPKVALCSPLSAHLLIWPHPVWAICLGGSWRDLTILRRKKSSSSL